MKFSYEFPAKEAFQTNFSAEMLFYSFYNSRRLNFYRWRRLICLAALILYKILEKNERQSEHLQNQRTESAVANQIRLFVSQIV